MNLRVLSRVVIYDNENKKILLVKNKGTSFWYAPGGGWEHEKENVIECAIREVYEETGLNVSIKKLLYLQEFQATKEEKFLEMFWLGTIIGDANINKSHIDLDPNGTVEEAKWFSQNDIQELQVFPKKLKKEFWEEKNEIDPFIGFN